MNMVYFVPYSEFQRIKTLAVSLQQRASLFSSLCRINTLYMITRAGSGHIGTSFSCMDMVSWIFLQETTADNNNLPEVPLYFSSKGHDAPALYAILTGLGYLDFSLIHKLRRLGGLPGHPDVATPFIQTNTGSLGMGISKAKGIARANRLRQKNKEILILTGDGELQEGQIWESLQGAANSNLDEITVIVDHNKIQSDTWVSKTSDLGDIEGKFKSFGWHVARCDGHSFNQFSTVLAECKKITGKPKVIIADTIKGKGVSFMEHTVMGSEGHENNLYRFHSGAPGADLYNRGVTELIDLVNRHLRDIGESPLVVESLEWPEAVLPEHVERLIPFYSMELEKAVKLNPKIVVLDADLCVDCGLSSFKQSFPERFIECGIAEQDMVSQAGGLALKGYLPVVHSFACFLSARPNEQIYNNATERTKVIYVGSLAGLLPGMPGHSHQAVRDIASLAAVPGLSLVEPSCEQELKMLLEYCIKSPGSFYIRLVSIPCSIPYRLPQEYGITPGRGIALTEGNDAILFSYGPVMLTQSYIAANQLYERFGIGLKVINLPWLNRFDSDWLKSAVLGYKWVFTVDNHYLVGGLGEMLTSHLAELGIIGDTRYKKFGVQDIPVCGTNDEVLKFHGLDAESLCLKIAKTMEVWRV